MKTKNTKETAKTAKVVKLEKANKKEQKTAKAQVLKEVKAKEKVSLLEKVISNREVKYLYPADTVDTLSRKKWRQGVRNKLKKYERNLYKLQQENDKAAFEKEQKAYLKYKATVVKIA